jgi:hypothetical protein
MNHLEALGSQMVNGSDSSTAERPGANWGRQSGTIWTAIRPTTESQAAGTWEPSSAA